MLKLILNLLGVNQIKNLTKKSGKILDVFTKTVSQLEAVNLQIDSESTEREEHKKRIEAELASLTIMKTENAKVISKIQKIFE